MKELSITASGMVDVTGRFSVDVVSPQFDSKPDSRDAVEEKIKYINWFLESSFLEHDQLFHDVGHGLKGGQQREQCHGTQNGVGNGIQKIEHGLSPCRIRGTG